MTESQPKPRNKRLIIGGLVLLLGTLLLFAARDDSPAGRETGSEQAGAEKSVVSVAVDVVNYGHDTSYGFTMYDLGSPEYAPISGDVVWPLQSGGSGNCCVRLPRQWRPGLKVRIKWTEGKYDMAKHAWPDSMSEHEQDLEIPRYDQPADLFVVFLPEQKVELVVSPAEPGHPEWAGRIKETPSAYCLARHSGKECRAAQPKLGADLSEIQGFCTYIQQERDDVRLCAQAVQECVRNYEDEDLCKKVLWGKRREGR